MKIPTYCFHFWWFKKQHGKYVATVKDEVKSNNELHSKITLSINQIMEENLFVYEDWLPIVHAFHGFLPEKIPQKMPF